MIKIIENKKQRIVNDIYKVCREDEILLNSIIRKVDYTTNYKNKMNIIQSEKRFGISNKKIALEKTDVYSIEVICNTKKQRIKFSKKLETEYTQLVIPYLGGWNEGCFITSHNINDFWFVNKKVESIETLKNMKLYIESKIVTYCVINYSKKIKPQPLFAFLCRLSEIDFSKEWTDDALYDEFNLNKEEIDEVENWCKANPKLMPRHDNHWSEY